jgi:hypothetical protein
VPAEKTEEVMLDIYARSPAGVPYPVLHGAEYLRIELSARADGKFLASLTATTVDEEEPQLIDQEIACERVASIEEFFALIKKHVRIAQQPAPLPQLS